MVKPIIPELNFNSNWGPMIVEPVDPEYTFEDDGNTFFSEESKRPHTPRKTVFDHIEDGTLLVNSGLYPSRTPHDVNQKQWNNIQRVSETVGEYISIGGGTSYSFYLYNSPTKGLVMVYVSNLSGSEGWYPVTMKEMSQTCYVSCR
jgi:hypothetical protein